MKIVFMGTPDFAVASLDGLRNAGHDILAVITSPDKPTGRGLQLGQSAVKQYAVNHEIKVLQPLKLKDPDFVADLQSLGADLFVVVAFRMLPEAIWAMPAKGTINLHASLLPQYRGAAPINWAIINGDKVTGCSTFFIEKEIDTGNIIEQCESSIEENDTFGDLYDRLKTEGSKLLVSTLAKIEKGELSGKKQLFHSDLKSAPKIYKETALIDWTRKAGDIRNLVRGLNPFPVAYTFLKDKSLRIYKATVLTVLPQGLTKYSFDKITLFTDHKNMLIAHCGEDFLSLQEIQLEGKKRMEVSEFLRGFKF